MSKEVKPRNIELLQHILRTGNHAGAHHTRERDVQTGRRRHPKHRKKPDADDAVG